MTSLDLDLPPYSPSEIAIVKLVIKKKKVEEKRLGKIINISTKLITPKTRVWLSN